MSRIQAVVIIAVCALIVLGVRLLPERQGWAEGAGSDAARREAWTQAALAVESDAPETVFARADAAARAIEPAAVKAAIAAHKASERYPEAQGGWRVPRNADSYVWLRNARNIIDHGNACDTLVDGDCRDTLAPAPTGHTMRYADVLHVRVLATALTIGEWVNPALPAEVTADAAIHLVALLGLFPAFLLGRRLGGHWIGGAIAALTAALHPMVLARSLSLDNDIWNVTLPLWIAWALGNALATSGTRRAGWLAATLVALWLQAMMWDGWVFIAILVGLTALAHPAIALSAGSRLRAANTWTIAAPIVAALALLLWWSGDIDQFARGDGSGPAWDGFPWALNYVAELTRLPPESILATTYGAVPLQLAVLGVVVLVRFRQLWEGSFWITFFVAMVCQGAALVLGLTHPDANRWWFAILLSAPMIVAGAIQLIERTARDSARESMALFVGLWLIAALYMSLGPARFQLLMAAPMALGLGALCGRLYFGLTRDRQPPMRIAVATLALLPIAPVAYGAWAVADNLAPSLLSRSLIAGLQSLRQRTPEDAILVNPWSSGYTMKYFADRPVFADGGLLLTHMPTWVDRIMASPDPEFAYNALRMLACVGDATPLPEGRDGLHGRLVALGLSPLKASIATWRMLHSQPATFAQTLAAEGIAIDDAQRLAESVRCEPPPVYLVVRSLQYTSGESFALGLDDPLRLATIRKAMGLKVADDVDIPQHEVDTARQALAANARSAYAAGLDGRFGPRHLQCRPDPERMHCVDHGGGNHLLVTGTPGSESDPIRVSVQTRRGIVEPSLGTVNVLTDDQVRRFEVAPARGGLHIAWHPGADGAVVGSDPLPLSLVARLSAFGGQTVPWVEPVDRFEDARQSVTVWRVRW